MTKLGIIGGGVMAEALLSRILLQQLYLPELVCVSDPVSKRRDELSTKYGIKVTADNCEAASAPVVVLAIKPQILESVAAKLNLTSATSCPELVISILAGVPLQQLEAIFRGRAMIRAMPNTPATVGAGITAIATGQSVNADHKALAEQIFQAVGEVVEVPESLMDAVTGLSGSGPAYVAIAIEALADGGVAVGLPRPIAHKLAVQTVLGTAQLLAESGLHPAELKDRVSSPGGTTIAGVAALEQFGLRTALIRAVRAARDRARELGS
jgi:pyrroline-5-carboxylate reductase